MFQQLNKKEQAYGRTSSGVLGMVATAVVTSLATSVVTNLFICHKKTQSGGKKTSTKSPSSSKWEQTSLPPSSLASRTNSVRRLSYD